MSAPARSQRTAEPFLWLLFSAGGTVAALTLPVLLLLFGVLFPLGLPSDHAHLLAVVHNPLGALVFFVICMLSLFHWAHRFRFTLEHGLKLGRFDRVIAVCCYGGAVVGSVAAVWALLSA